MVYTEDENEESCLIVDITRVKPLTNRWHVVRIQGKKGDFL